MNRVGLRCCAAVLRSMRRRNPLGQESFSQPLRRSLVVDRLDPPPRSLLAAGQNPAWQSVSYPTV
jgi:hypothetical protein